MSLLLPRPDWAPWICTSPSGHNEGLKRHPLLFWRKYWTCLWCGRRSWKR